MTTALWSDIINVGGVIMRNHTADDFIAADITVEKVLDVSHMASSTWSRNKKVPRHCEGIMYFVSGNIEYEFGDCIFRSYPGCVLKLPTGVPYKGRRLNSDPVEIYLVDFTCEPGSFDLFPIPHSFFPTDPDGVIKEFRQILELYKSRTVCSYLECKAAVSKLLCNLAKDIAINKYHYGAGSRIMRMCEFIRENCHNSSFRVSDVSKHFHISEAHLRRIFSSEIHTSPVAYLMASRVELAKALLISRTELGVGGVAYECGFTSVYYFSTVFKRLCGHTPTEYRAKFDHTSG